MLQHGSAPAVQAAPAVGPLGVVDIAAVCELLGVSRSWLENTSLVKFADLQAWVESKARAA